MSATRLDALVVVGACPHAERNDRPIASAVAHALELAFEDAGAHAEEGHGPQAEALVLTDVWYLNDAELSSAPMVSVGGYAANALSARLIHMLPTVYAVDGRFAIHADPTLDEPRVCLWGTTRDDTEAAADTFITKYAERFVASANAAVGW